MIKILLGIALLLGISFIQTEPESKKNHPIREAATPQLGPELPSEPYLISFAMNPSEAGLYDLVIKMQLFNGAHYISPNAKRDFSGKFTVHIDESNALKLLSGLRETPRSVEVFDEHPFTNGVVNWVREDTQYYQSVQPVTGEDFQVTGWVRFTIEPRCTLEKVPFIIKQKNGKLVAELFQC